METKKLQISDDEIVVNISTKKAGFWGIIISIIIFVGIVSLCGFLGGKYSHLFQPNFAIILGLLTGIFFTKSFFWLMSTKQYTITVDKKYIIIYDSFGRQRVYKMADIRNICISPDYRLSLWAHLRAFFLNVTGGCIGFNYANIKTPIRIGYGLATSEAEELLEIVQEKGWIQGFQLSDTALEYKMNPLMKYVIWIVVSLIFIYFISIIILKEPYKRDILPIHIGFMIVLALFSFCEVIMFSSGSV